MRQTATRELFDYWNRLRGPRAAPERAEIDLAAIRGVLPDMFMLDVDAGRHFPFLMAGTRVSALFCAEQMGRSFLELWPTQEIHNISATLSTVIDAACPVIVAASARPEGYRDADVEILLLPLRHNGPKQARILGLVTPALQPSWLGLLPVPYFGLRSLRAIGETAEWPETQFAPFPMPPRPQLERRTKPAEIRGHLRVFEGGK